MLIKVFILKMLVLVIEKGNGGLMDQEAMLASPTNATEVLENEKSVANH